MTETADSTLITEAQAAERLQVSVRTLADMRRSGRGPLWYDLGTGDRPVVRYRAGDVDEWLAARAR